MVQSVSTKITHLRTIALTIEQYAAQYWQEVEPLQSAYQSVVNLECRIGEDDWQDAVRHAAILTREKGLAPSLGTPNGTYLKRLCENRDWPRAVACESVARLLRDLMDGKPEPFESFINSIEQLPKSVENLPDEMAKLLECMMYEHIIRISQNYISHMQGLTDSSDWLGLLHEIKQLQPVEPATEAAVSVWENAKTDFVAGPLLQRPHPEVEEPSAENRDFVDSIDSAMIERLNTIWPTIQLRSELIKEFRIQLSIYSVREDAHVQKVLKWRSDVQQWIDDSEQAEHDASRRIRIATSDGSILTQSVQEFVEPHVRCFEIRTFPFKAKRLHEEFEAWLQAAMRVRGIPPESKDSHLQLCFLTQTNTPAPQDENTGKSATESTAGISAAPEPPVENRGKGEPEPLADPPRCTLLVKLGKPFPNPSLPDNDQIRFVAEAKVIAKDVETGAEVELPDNWPPMGWEGNELIPASIEPAPVKAWFDHWLVDFDGVVACVDAWNQKSTETNQINLASVARDALQIWRRLHPGKSDPVPCPEKADWITSAQARARLIAIAGALGIDLGKQSAPSPTNDKKGPTEPPVDPAPPASPASESTLKGGRPRLAESTILVQLYRRIHEVSQKHDKRADAIEALKREPEITSMIRLCNQSDGENRKMDVALYESARKWVTRNAPGQNPAE